jgi:hypothetical protein
LANLLFLAHKKIDDYDESTETLKELWDSVYNIYLEILDEILEVKKQLKHYKENLGVDFDIVKKLKKEICSNMGIEFRMEHDKEAALVQRATCCSKCNIF